MFSRIILLTRNIISVSRNNKNAIVNSRKRKKKRNEKKKAGHNSHNKTDIAVTVVVAKNTL